MDKRRKWVLITVILAVVSGYLSLYTVAAHDVADRYIIEDESGEPWWKTMSEGSLFPWPHESGMLEAITKAGETDAFVYSYLLKTGGLFIITLITWSACGLSAYRAGRFV